MRLLSKNRVLLSDSGKPQTKVLLPQPLGTETVRATMPRWLFLSLKFWNFMTWLGIVSHPSSLTLDKLFKFYNSSSFSPSSENFLQLFLITLLPMVLDRSTFRIHIYRCKNSYLFSLIFPGFSFLFFFVNIK